MTNLKKFILGAALCLFSLSPLVFADCTQSCPGGPNDCTDRLCQGCYTDIFGDATEFNCQDCCIETSSVTCTENGCFWEYSGIKGADECRNESGVDCSGIPEVPTQSKTWLLVAFSVAGLGLALALRFKKGKAV